MYNQNYKQFIMCCIPDAAPLSSTWGSKISPGTAIFPQTGVASPAIDAATQVNENINNAVFSIFRWPHMVGKFMIGIPVFGKNVPNTIPFKTAILSMKTV